MEQLFWSLLGAATMLALFLAATFTRRMRAARIEPLEEDSPLSALEQSLDTELELDDGRELEALAGFVGSQIADMASGVEGSSQLLIESIGKPEDIAAHAEELWINVHSLRMFARKILTFAEPVQPEVGVVDLRTWLTKLRHELESYVPCSSNVEMQVADCLPRVKASAQELHHAAMFLVDSLLSLQPQTSVLTVRASMDVQEDEDMFVVLEIFAESDEAPEVETSPSFDAHLGFRAARRILVAQGIDIRHAHVGGCNLGFFLSLPAAQTPEEAAEQYGPAAPLIPHPFGGVLILEDDLGVREMLAREMRKTGRNILTCTDGASANSLLEATPDRFELLILDEHSRLRPGSEVARRALDLNPEVKILLLTNGPSNTSGMREEERVRTATITKPFALSELRESLDSLLVSR